MSILKEIEKHNKKVSDEFKRARMGETIDLTALMINKERIEEKRNKYRR